jgi:hypothetical protein
VVAGFAEEVTGPDGRCAGASDDELIGVLRAWQRQESRAAARKLAVIAELIRRRPAPGHAPCVPGGLPQAWGRFCGDELAAATATSGQAAEKTLTLAHDLAARLPGTARALHDGLIDVGKARIIADATRVLGPAGAAAAEALILAGIGTRTPGQVRAAAGRAVITIDPDAARQRREQAQKDARVQLWREDAGTAALCGYGLPPDEALAADQMITARARELRACGVDGTTDQLRVRAYLDFLLGQDSRHRADTARSRQADEGGQPREGSEPDGSCQPGEDGQPHAGSRPDEHGGHSTRPPGSEQGGGRPGGDREQPGGRTGGCGAPSGAPASPGRAGAAGPAGIAAQINLTIPLATLLGLAGRPGEAHGLGALDPDLARTLAENAATNPATSWCLTVTDQHGHPTAHGCARPTRSRPAGRKNTPGEGGPAGTGGTGNRDGPAFTVQHPGDGRSGAGGHGTWRLRTPGPAGRDYTISIGPLAVADCDHRDQSAGYQPSDRLRHLVQIRDGECTWPPCRRTARACDFEHALPWDQGGRTCACNAGARCRHHHLAKQDPGWRLDQHLPGYHTWTTPSGRTYTTGPTEYPI